MDLWIRTQDRENTVKIINQYGLKFNDKKTIIANFQPDFTDKYDGYYEVLGTYESKERALEVLDEIQNIIRYNKMFKVNNEVFAKTLNSNLKLSKDEQVDLLLKMFVYPMPKK